MIEDTIKSCNNCKNFKRHYVQANSRLISLNYGHCVLPQKRNKTPTLCYRWENVPTDAKIEQKKIIIKTLELMSKQLNDIHLILNCDD